MKIAYRLFFLLLISAFLFSCSEKKAGIEGKIVDGQGQPISGITVIFKQVQESKGYEQFETKTLVNGVFRIDGVMPASEYIITPVSDNWKTKVTTKITTSAEGQILAISDPIVVRFNTLKDGTVVDTKTGLQWLMMGITDLNSGNVLDAVKNIKEGGFTDWRLPTKTELLQLQETPVAPVIQPETGLSQKTCCVWVAELNSENVEWKFYVDDGNDVWSSSSVPPDDRIVVVRHHTGAASATPASGPAAPSANLTAESPAVSAPSVAASPAKEAPSAIVTRYTEPNNSIGDSATIQFGMNKTTISPEELSKLKAFYAKIKGKNGRIVIEGHSDSDGDAAANFKISGDRALIVKAMLHRLELSKDFDVKIAGLSDTKPIADNTTEEGRKLNRRADITFFPDYSATSTATPAKQAPSARSRAAAAPVVEAPVVAAPAKQAPPPVIETATPVKRDDGVLKASRKACLANKGQYPKPRVAAAPVVAAPVVEAPAKQAPPARTSAPAAPVVAAPAKQAPPPVIETATPVKRDDGVLRASRKACLAKKAQSTK